tara:strand:+ start:194 stop:4732 length:4539 start_codon:yes stop_codon:yes gene_type:complete
MSKKKLTYQELEKEIIQLKSEIKLKESEDRFSMLLKASEDMISIHEPNGRYIYYNGPKCYAITAKDVVGKTITDFFEDDISLQLLNTFKRVVKTGKSERIELLFDWLGEKKWFLEYIYPIKNNNGDVIELVKVCRDIHKRKIAEQIIAEQNAEKETQLKELEISRHKIQNSLELLEKSKYSMNEASKIAKIGYWDHDLITNTVTWSDYIHSIFGTNPKDGVPLQEEIFKNFDNESREKLKKATLELTTKGTSYDIEVKWTNENEEEIWLRNVAQPIYNKENQIIGKRGVMQNITSSKIVQLQLEVSRQTTESSLELLAKREFSMNEASKTAKIGFFEDNVVTETRVWSEYLYQIFGLDPKEEIPPRKELSKLLMNEENQQKLAKSLSKLDTEGISFDIEIEMNNLRKEKIWVRAVVQPVYNKENKIVGRRGVMQDITVFKKTEQELQISKQQIQTTLDLLEKSEYSKNEASNTAKIGYHHYNIETDTFTWSENLYRFFGLDHNKPVPSRDEILKCFDKESQNKMKEATLDLDSKGIPYDLELKIINFKDKEVWVRNVAEAVYNEKNEIIGRRGVTQDITEQKQIEYKNLIITENYKKLFDNATISIWNEDLSLVFEKIEELKKLNISDIEKYFDENPQVLFSVLDKIKVNKVNKSTLKLFKATSSEEFIENIQSTFGKGANKVFGKFIEAIWNGEKTFISEVNYKTFDGVEFAAVISIPIPQSEAERKTVPVSIQSVQGIKDAEHARKKSLNKLKAQSEFITAMTENQPAGIIACNSKGKLVLFNKTAKEWHGIDILNVPQEKWAENYGLFKIGGKIRLKNNEVPLIRAFSGEKVSNVEVVIKSENNEPRIVICNGSSFSDSEGNKLGAVIVMNDITEQKKIENNLKRSQAEIKKTIKELERSEFLLNESGRLTKVGAWELEIPSQKIRWSDQVFNIHGIPLGKIPSLEECMSFYIEGSDEILAEAIEESIAKNKKFDLVLRFENKKNEKLWLNVIGYPLTNKEGEITSLIGILHDITEQKIKQNKLDAQNEKLNLLNKAFSEAQELSRLGNWEYNIATDEVKWSDELFNIFEREKSLGAPPYSEQKILFTEESYVLMDEAVGNCIKHEIPYNLELDIYTKSGSLKHVISRGRVIKDKENKVIGCYGTAQDITLQKQTRRKIEEAEKMYRLLTDNANDLICLHEPDSSFTYISPSIKSLLGYEQEEFLGKKALSIVHKEDVQNLKDELERRAQQNLFTGTFSCRVLHKKGHYIWLEFLSSPVFKNRKISHFVSSARDITQSVVIKEEIEEYQHSLQKLTTEITLIEEKQKKEIASNIHDHLSQSLVISKMKINEMKKNPHLKETLKDLKFIETNISSALENSRKITYELSPPVLYQLGILDALYWLLDNIEVTHKIKCKVNSNTTSVKLSDAASILLYRSIQEVINNTIKYANATLITLDLDKNNSGLDIFVTDNGVGFDTSSLNNHSHNHSGSGFGLFTVQERIQNIKGKFTIKSKINIGTTVKFFIPLSI